MTGAGTFSILLMGVYGLCILKGVAGLAGLGGIVLDGLCF